MLSYESIIEKFGMFSYLIAFNNVSLLSEKEIVILSDFISLSFVRLVSKSKPENSTFNSALCKISYNSFDK